MGIKDFFRREKKEALPDANVMIQNAKIEEQRKMMESQQDRIDKIVKNVQHVEQEVRDTKSEINRIKEEQNRCVSTYTRYDPSKISELHSNLRVRRLNKKSDFNYIVSLVLGEDKTNEIVMGQFNSGNIKIIKAKFEEIIEFQEALKYGEIEEEIIQESYRKFEEYAKENEITITPEAEKILTNSENEPINVTKTMLYVGSDNMVEKNNVLDNEDIVNDFNNFSPDEQAELKPTNSVINEVVNLNRKENIGNLIEEGDNIFSNFFEQNPTEEEVFKKLHRESIETDIFIDSIGYFRKGQKDFEGTAEYKYIRLFILGRTEEAKEYYRNNKLNITNKRLTISKSDSREDIRKKLNINRMFSCKHKENLEKLTEEEKAIFDTFLDSVNPNKDYEKINEARKKEDIYLAGILDRVKTETIKSNTKNIKRYNELMERQGFEDRINYDISDNDDDQR